MSLFFPPVPTHEPSNSKISNPKTELSKRERQALIAKKIRNNAFRKSLGLQNYKTNKSPSASASASIKSNTKKPKKPKQQEKKVEMIVLEINMFIYELSNQYSKTKSEDKISFIKTKYNSKRNLNQDIKTIKELVDNHTNEDLNKLFELLKRIKHNGKGGNAKLPTIQEIESKLNELETQQKLNQTPNTSELQNLNTLSKLANLKVHNSELSLKSGKKKISVKGKNKRNKNSKKSSKKNNRKKSSRKKSQK